MDSSKVSHLNISQEIQNFIESIPVGIILTEIDSTVVYVNSIFTQIVGKTPDAIIGRKLSENLFKEDLSTFLLWFYSQKSQIPNATSFIGRCPKQNEEFLTLRFTKHAFENFDEKSMHVLTVEKMDPLDNSKSINFAVDSLWSTVTDALNASPQGFNIWQGLRNKDGELDQFKVLFMNRVGALPHGVMADKLMGVDIDVVYPECRAEGFFQALVNAVETHRVSEMILESSQNAKWPGTFANVIIPLSDDRVANSFREVTDELNELQSLRDRARLDPLTGLLNRNAFDSYLNTELAELEIYPHPMAVCFIDIDNFKLVNDNFGHQAGDYILQNYANKIQMCLRVGDLVGRLGGDEFAVLLSGLQNHSELESICERIKKNLNSIVVWNEEAIEVSASIGVAYHEGNSRVLTSNILREADQAMYSAKKSGKNCYKIIKIE